MEWYKKYMTVFEQPYESIPSNIKAEIRNKLTALAPKENPTISIVAIAHNEESHILACLWSLSENILYHSAELIVVSNHSTDQTNNILEEMGVCWYNEERKGPGFARQCGLDYAKGKYHICIDTDTMYPPQYIQTHIDYLSQDNIVCTYSLWSFIPEKPLDKLSLFVYETLRDFYLCLLNINRPELCVRGMVMAFRTQEGKLIKYKTNIIRGEDGSMAFGLKSKGRLKLILSTKARAITCNSTLKGHGSIFQNFLQRAIKGLKYVPSLFTSKREYKDKPSNLIQ